MQELPDLSDLNRFANRVWGIPEALIRRLPQGATEFIDLGEYFEAFTRLSSNIIRHEKILVREEYRTALQALQKDEYQGGVYLTGQPGIGKTYFLVYALVQFLGKKQPVALHHLGSLPYYFIFKENVACYSLGDDNPLFQYSPMWALSDSNADVKIPPPVFRGNAKRIRVIQTTSPNASRYKEWSKQYGASCYIMDLWTEEEVVSLATLLELHVERMVNLAKKWGTVPRTLLKYINTDDQKVEDLYCGAIRQAVEKCPVMMDGALQLDFPTRSPSQFFFVGPRKRATGIVDRDIPDVTVPTRTLRELMGKGIRGQRNETKLGFYMALSQCAQTRQAAGYIFESWIHSFLLAGNEMQCQWIPQPGSDGSDDIAQLPSTIRGTDILIPATLKALKIEMPPYYWLPPHTSFPGVDSVLVFEKQIIAFQVRISAEHKSPIESLHKLRKSLPSRLKNVRWRMVFVGAAENSIKRVAAYWASRLRFRTEEMRIPVAWSEVDPMQEDVTYKAYRDVDDPVPKDSDEELMEVDQE